MENPELTESPQSAAQFVISEEVKTAFPFRSPPHMEQSAREVCADRPLF